MVRTIRVCGQNVQIMVEDEAILLFVITLGATFAAFAVKKWAQHSGGIPGEVKYISNDCVLKFYINSLICSRRIMLFFLNYTQSHALRTPLFCSGCSRKIMVFKQNVTFC